MTLSKDECEILKSVAVEIARTRDTALATLGDVPPRLQLPIRATIRAQAAAALSVLDTFLEGNG